MRLQRMLKLSQELWGIGQVTMGHPGIFLWWVPFPSHQVLVPTPSASLCTDLLHLVFGVPVYIDCLRFIG